ncbi:hypothetical protein, partial [Paracoccus saliphilus]|uniref:hypothetical protein n=1 Tax=Paracoccus saliphilus TaxID=405559 RepID=UPI002657534C
SSISWSVHRLFDALIAKGVSQRVRKICQSSASAYNRNDETIVAASLKYYQRGNPNPRRITYLYWIKQQPR